MFEMIEKAKWATARVVFLAMATAGTASGGLFAYLVAPLYSWYFFGDLNFTKYHRHFLPLAKCCFKFVWELINNPVYRNAFGIPLMAPPMMSPDHTQVAITPTWQDGSHCCSICNNCCFGRDCPLIDDKTHLCKSYGSFFWRYFNCGRYPENNKQIRLYDCPKWEVIS